jgi:hypothetical protein
MSARGSVTSCAIFWTAQPPGANDREAFAKELGNPKEGYHWAPVYLPNGTSIRMEYERETCYAPVKFGKIHVKEQALLAFAACRALADYSTVTLLARLRG